MNKKKDNRLGNILIVDDEKDIRQLISDILKDEGYSTKLAANSTECINEINSSPPDLLILDIWLKDSHMDGIDILKVAQRDNPEIPVVIISGMEILKLQSLQLSKVHMILLKNPLIQINYLLLLTELWKFLNYGVKIVH